MSGSFDCTGRHVVVTDSSSIARALETAAERLGSVAVPLAEALARDRGRPGSRVSVPVSRRIRTAPNDAVREADADKAPTARVPPRHAGAADDGDGPLPRPAPKAGSGMTGSPVAVDGGHLVSGFSR